MADTKPDECALRHKVKLCCPECYGVRPVSIKAYVWVRIDSDGLIATAVPRYSDECDAQCECGWGGSVDDAYGAYKECCRYCGADPDNIGSNDEGARYCAECGAEQR